MAYLDNCTNCLRLKNKDGGIDILPYSKFAPSVRNRPFRPDPEDKKEPTVVRQNYTRADFI